MATDRYTRGTYTFGEDVAKDNTNYVSGTDSGYMFEINGGVVDIYYGKGFYNETEDGIVQNELRKVVFEGKKSFADSQINPLYKRVRR
jgi:hypothetical protein